MENSQESPSLPINALAYILRGSAFLAWCAAVAWTSPTLLFLSAAFGYGGPFLLAAAILRDRELQEGTESAFSFL